MGIGKRIMIVLAAALIVAGNFGSGAAYAVEKPLLYLKGIPSRVAPGDEFTATLAIEGVSSLYGFQIYMTYDSSLLEVLDEDASAPGTNVAQRMSYKTVSENGAFGGVSGDIVVVNSGEIEYTVMNDTPYPVYGSIDIADIRFKAKAEGKAAVVFQRSDYPHQKVYVFYENEGRVEKVEPALGDVMIDCAEEGAVDTTAPSVNIISTSPETINPDSTDVEVRKTIVTYSLNEDAGVFAWVEIWNSDGAGQKVNTILYETDMDGVSENPVRTLEWDGSGSIDDEDYYVVVIEARDAAGNVNRARSPKITVDRTAPVLTLKDVDSYAFSPNGDLKKDRFIAILEVGETADVQAVVFNYGVRMLEIGSVEAGAEFELNWDGRNNQGEVLSDMKCMIRVTAEDSVGNKGTLDITGIILDTSAPGITPKKPLKYSFNTTPEIAAAVSEMGVSGGLQTDTAKFRIDQGSFFNAGFSDDNLMSFTPYTPIGYGERTVTAEVYDLAGNKGTSSWSFEVTPAVDVEITDVSQNPFNPESGPTQFTIANNWVKDVVVSTLVHGPSGSLYVLQNTDVSEGSESIVVWDGKKYDGNYVSNGEYSIEFRIADLDGYGLIDLEENVEVDRQVPVVNLLSMSPAPPDNFIRISGGQAYPSDVAADFSVTDNVSQVCNIRAYVRTYEGETLRTLLKKDDFACGSDVSVSWNGRDAYGAVPPDGLYRIILEAQDEAGNKGSNSGSDEVIYYMDNTGPEVELVNPPEGGDTGAFTSEIRLFVSDGEYGSGVSESGAVMYLDGSLVASETSWNENNSELVFSLTLENNWSELTVNTVDKLGNPSGGSFRINIDTGEPVRTEILSPEQNEDGSIYVSGITDVVAYAQDNAGGTGIGRIELYVDSIQKAVATVSGTSVTASLSLDVTEYEDGEYELKVVAYDALDNANEDSIEVIVGNAAPVVVGAEAGNGGYFSNDAGAMYQDVAVTADVEEDNPFGCVLQVWSGDKALADSVMVYEGEESAEAGAESCAVSWTGEDTEGASVADGEYVYYISATDAAGNGSNELSGVLTLDSVAPETLAVISPAADVVSGIVLFAVNARDAGSGVTGARYTLELAGLQTVIKGELEYSEIDSDYRGTWETDTDDDGVYGLLFSAVDMAGNIAETSQQEVTVLNDSVSITNVRDVPDPFSPGSVGDFGSVEIAFNVVTNDDSIGFDRTLTLRLKEPTGIDDPEKVYTESGVGGTDGLNRYAQTVVWSGELDSGTLVDGVYEYEIVVVPTLGDVKTKVGQITVDTTPPEVLSYEATPEDYISPNGDGVTDTLVIVVGALDASDFSGTVEILCETSSSGCNAPYTGVEPLAGLSMSGAAEAMTAVWYGRVDGEIVADGTYAYRISFTDAAGNTTEILDTVIKNNPPVITVPEEGVAFSPNGDGRKDTAEIEWTTDKAGNFTIEMYTLMCTPGTSGCSGTQLQGETQAADGDHLFSWAGSEAGGVEWKYYIRISGYSEVGALERPNEAQDAWVEVVLDVTPPVLETYYPYEDEFTDLGPKLKVTARDELSGLSESFAGDTTITVDSLDYETHIETVEEEVYRVWARMNPALAEGPHFLESLVEDRAGNRTHLGPVRFVSITPVLSGFGGTELDDVYWQADTDVGGGDGSYSMVTLDGSGHAVLSHGVTSPADEIQETGLGMKGKLFDVSRKETVIEATISNILTSESTYAGIFAGGLSYESPEGEFSQDHPFGYMALLAVMFDFDDNGDPRLKVFRGIGASESFLIRSAFTGVIREDMPITLRLVYEEGELDLYIIDEAGDTRWRWTGSISMEYMSAGFYMFSNPNTGFSREGTVELDSFVTNIARPVIDGIAAYDAADSTDRVIVYEQDSYEMQLTGTPWQKDVKGYLLNMDNPLLSNDDPDYLLGGAVTSGPVEMEESPEGSGNYTSGALQIDSLTDNSGYGARVHMPVAVTAGFTTLNWPLGMDEMYSNPARALYLVTEAVELLEITNNDGPPDYGYIQAGDRYTISAQTRPGDWNIRVYLVNFQTLATTYDVDAAKVEGPFKMVKTADGEYEYSSVLNNTVDATGEESVAIGPVAEFGPRFSERSYGANALYVGEPPIREVVVENLDRPGAEDVIEGETVRIEATGQEGMTMVCALINPDSTTGDIAAVSDIVPMTQDGNVYTADVPMDELVDSNGDHVTRIQGIAAKMAGDSPDFWLISWNELAGIERDRIAPAAPVDIVISSGDQERPSTGDTVSAPITWTPPAENSDGSSLEDLAGYNLYRVSVDGNGEPVFEKATSDPLEGTTYVDSYTFTTDTYVYVVTAVDTTGNESEISANLASLSTNFIYQDGISLSNGPSSVPTGYIRGGEEYRITGTVNETGGSQNYYIVNAGSLESGEPFSEAIIDGPFLVTLGGVAGDEIDITGTLPTLEDADGDIASRVIAVIVSEDIDILGYTTADGELKGGVAPVREVHIANADRPDKTELRLGETIEITASGNPGLDLIATITNPDNMAGDLPSALSQDRIQLTEEPSGSGNYIGNAEVITNIDEEGQPAVKVGVLVDDTNGDFDPAVPSSETIDLLEAPELAGTITVTPAWIMTGWNFSSDYSITSNSGEYLENAVISVSVVLPDGGYAYTASEEKSINPGEGITGTLTNPEVYVTSGTYSVALWMDINSYRIQIAETTMPVVADVLSGALALDRPSYISGENATVNVSLTNVSGYELTAISPRLELVDGSGTTVAVAAIPAISQLPENGTYTDTVSLDMPVVDSDTRYTLGLVAEMNGKEDSVAQKNATVLAESIIADGELNPETIISNQEPVFSYSILNRTNTAIENGIVTGVIVSSDYQQGDPVYATFTGIIEELAKRESVIMSSTFSPVQGDPGEYKLELYIQDDNDPESKKIFEMPVTVESCDL